MHILFYLLTVLRLLINMLHKRTRTKGNIDISKHVQMLSLNTTFYIFLMEQA